MTDTSTIPFSISRQVDGMPVSATLRMNEIVADRRLEGETVFHMGFGESPFPVPERITQALSDAAYANKYPPTLGLSDLRQKALTYFAGKLGFKADRFQTMVAPGSKDVIFASQIAIDGDILLPTPSWVTYAPQAQLCGTKAIRLPTQSSDHHRITGALIKSTIEQARSDGFRPKKLLLNYPNNPTGLGISKEDLQDIAAVCREAGIIVISDEIYSLVSHNEPHQSIAGYYPEGTIVTTGLSKHLSLGGYRIGFVPEALNGLLQAMGAVASETWSCVSHPIQLAAIVAVEEHQDVEEHIDLCTTAHGLITNYVRDRIVKIGIEYPPLVGSFYLYPDFTPFVAELANAYGVRSCKDLAHDLLTRASVASLPASDFGDEDYVLALRLSTTDYDGAEALAYIRSNPEASAEELVANACPRVAGACDAIGSYITAAVDNYRLSRSG